MMVVSLDGCSVMVAKLLVHASWLKASCHLLAMGGLAEPMA